MLDWYREEDAGDPKRSELIESCLNALKEKSEKSDQNIVIKAEFVKNSVMNAKIDSEVMMDLSTFKISVWNKLQPSNQHFFEGFIDEDGPWLLIGIPNRGPFFATHHLERHSASSDQHTKKVMSLRGGHLVMMQCYMRQRVADRSRLREHPRGHASWRESTMRNFTKESRRWNIRRRSQNQVNMYEK